MTIFGANYLPQRGYSEGCESSTGLPHVLGGPAGLMKCPTCNEHTPDHWEWLYTATDELEFPAKQGSISIEWMYCANNDCKDLILRVHGTRREYAGGGPVPISHTDTWLAYPKFGQTSRPIDPLVPDEIKRDYAEAAIILEQSPRMSAVLSRRILADLLEKYAGKTHFGLADRIDAFNAETKHPYELRKNLHYLREIADLSAHTKVNDQAQIVDVDGKEAEWTLEILDQLFDYFIISPEKNRTMRAAIDEKLNEAHRKPIKPLPDDRGLTP